MLSVAVGQSHAVESQQPVNGKRDDEPIDNPLIESYTAVLEDCHVA